MTDEVEEVADGIWILRGGVPRIMNVYLVRDGNGVLAYDAGIRPMARAIADAASALGGLTRIILGHAHFDHRGAAPRLGVPVLCHPDEVADAQGDGGAHNVDLALVSRRSRLIGRPLRWLFDGGPVHVSATIEHGDPVADFEVIHLPGHTPGLIGLWRASDRIALVSDCFYTMDTETARTSLPHVPHRAYNVDTDLARQSIRRLAELQPSSAWPGHAGPLTGDVAAQLREAADRNALRDPTSIRHSDAMMTRGGVGHVRRVGSVGGALALSNGNSARGSRGRLSLRAAPWPAGNADRTSAESSRGWWARYSERGHQMSGRGMTDHPSAACSGRSPNW
ncbi:MBL fold metallo-hydrolase [Mycobacterium sp. pV006]|uniref:MBL fold metallo-hydrolase n=1 Tax=Mycobacterium sp. pV006 TaxID=3238983 RepID=UPI00351B150F